MFGDVFRFELLYRFKRPPVYFFAGLFFLMTACTVASDSMQMGGAIGNAARNSPYEILRLMQMMSAMALLALTGFVATAVNRDYEYGAHEMFYATPVGKLPFLAGRFGGSLIASFAVVVASALGIMVGSQMPWLDPERIQAFQAGPYAYAMLVYALPNLFIVGAFLFAFATLTRKVLFTYIAMFGILIGWAFSVVLLRDVENVRLAALIDPFGLSAFQAATRYWTVVERNTMLPPLTGDLLVNRLIWLAVGTGALALTWARFRLAVTETARRLGRRAREAAGIVAGGVSQSLDVAMPAVTLSFGLRARVAQWLDQTRTEVASVFRSVPFLVVLVFGVFNLAANTLLPESGTTTYPLTGIMLRQISGGFELFLFVVLLIYAGQLVWRERQSRMHEIHDALPVPDWMPLTAKFTALGAISVALLTVAMVTTIIGQLARGYTNLELGLYLRGLFAVSLSWWLIFAALMVAVQVFVNNKILGFAILLIYYTLVDALPSLGVDHHLIVFGTAPDAVYSDMNGYGHYVAPMVWFKTYWGLLSVALLLLAISFYVRGTDVRGAGRFREARRRASRPRSLALAASLVGFAVVGGWIYQNTNVLNDWLTMKHLYDRAALYEERYKEYEGLAQPRIADVRFEVDVYPERRAVDLRGDLKLVNRSDETISELHMVFPDEFELTSINLPDDAIKLDDLETSYRIYSLPEPLEPGDAFDLAYEAQIVSRGFRDRNFDTRVVENGTFLPTSRVMPGIGYDRDAELKDPHERRRRSMPPQEGMLEPGEPGALDNTITAGADWVSFEAVLSTSPDQTALTAGALVREWEDGGRRYSHYKAEVPILNFYPFLSGRWDVARGDWNGVAIEVYHHPTHGYNVERMIESVQRALAYCSENYGPYQHNHVRIVEFPRYERFAQSFPGIIPYSEASHFIEDLRKERNIDMVFYITAHEVAHQWWGHQVAAAYAKGATFIEEGMAQYSALMVMEEDYGRDQMERFMSYELDRYLSGRGEARREELPLVRCDNQAYIHYFKGSLTLYALRDYIGEERLNAALGEYVERVRFEGPPYPASPEFVSILRNATPEEYRYLIEDMFETITLYDNRCEEARCEETDDGRYLVTLSLRSRKVRADGDGVETEVAHSDWIELGLFGEESEGEEPPIYLEKHRLTSGANEVELVVDERPVRAGIDPRHLLIDRVPRDNARRVVES
jgi:ABC-2 type transport system permease protein